MYVFGINLPLPEILLVLILFLVAALIFILFQFNHINKHIQVLESTTLEIRKFEEQEMQQVQRFEIDMRKLEAEEAELFVTKVVPTVSKLENYVAVQLLKGKDPETIRGAITKKGISPELATRVVNSMSYYLAFFKKMPNKHMNTHFNTVNKMRVPPPK